MHRRLHRAILFATLVGAAALLTSCGRDAGSPTKIDPASVTIDEVTGLGVVSFIETAVTRVGVETAEVTSEVSPRGGPRVSAIPYSALIYDKKGATFTYIVTDTGVYARAPIEVDFIEGSWVYLADGPDVGTPIVTVGAAEIYGAETGVGK